MKKSLVVLIFAALLMGCSMILAPETTLDIPDDIEIMLTDIFGELPPIYVTDLAQFDAVGRYDFLIDRVYIDDREMDDRYMLQVVSHELMHWHQRNSMKRIELGKTYSYDDYAIDLNYSEQANIESEAVIASVYCLLRYNPKRIFNHFTIDGDNYWFTIKDIPDLERYLRKYTNLNLD